MEKLPPLKEVLKNLKKIDFEDTTKKDEFQEKELKNHYSSPYGLTSPEELDELEKTNPLLYSAIVNWN